MSPTLYTMQQDCKVLKPFGNGFGDLERRFKDAPIRTLTLEQWVHNRENHLFCHHVNCWIKIMQKHSLEVKLL